MRPIELAISESLKKDCLSDKSPYRWPFQIWQPNYFKGLKALCYSSCQCCAWVKADNGETSWFAETIDRTWVDSSNWRPALCSRQVWIGVTFVDSCFQGMTRMVCRRLEDVVFSKVQVMIGCLYSTYSSIYNTLVLHFSPSDYRRIPFISMTQGVYSIPEFEV